MYLLSVCDNRCEPNSNTYGATFNNIDSQQQQQQQQTDKQTAQIGIKSMRNAILSNDLYLIPRALSESINPISEYIKHLSLNQQQNEAN